MNKIKIFNKSKKNSLEKSIIWSRGFYNISKDYEDYHTEEVASEIIIKKIIENSKDHIWLRLGTTYVNKSLKRDIDIFSENIKYLKKPIDLMRTILFGHTPTLKHLHKDDSQAGLVWYSDVKLDDGRSMAVGLDTCLYHDFNLPKVLAAYNIQTNEIIYQNLIID